MTPQTVNTCLTGRACQEDAWSWIHVTSRALSWADTMTCPSMPAVKRPTLRSVTRRTLSQRVHSGAEHQLLQIADPFEVPCLRRREDPLRQTPYAVLDRTPIHRVPVEDLALRSVHRDTTCSQRSR
jgi:hypothetical protein